MRRRLKRLAIVVLATGAALAGWWLWYSTRDYGALFLQRRGQPASVAASTGDITLQSDTGLRAQARVRVPTKPGKVQGVLLAAGLETGMRVVDLIGPREDMVVLAVDYGWEGEFDIASWHSFFGTMRRLRRSSMETVPRLLLGLDYLARHPQVDPERIVVVGVSYGSYYALPAAALEPRVRRLILVQGGGEMGAILAANAKRWRAPLPPRALGWVGEGVFLPLQPERWIGRLAPRRVTFIASRTDPEFPVSAVQSVYERAGQPKDLVWHDTPHVAPEAAEIIAELARVVVEQLGREPR